MSRLVTPAAEGGPLLLLRQYAAEAAPGIDLLPDGGEEDSATTYWRIAKKAAKQGRTDVIRQLVLLASSSEGAALHALSASSAPVLAAAAAGHADVVFLLLPLSLRGLLPSAAGDDRGRITLFRNLLVNAAASGNLELLRDILLLSASNGRGGGRCGSSKYDLLADAHSAAAARGHVHVLEWLWGSDDEGNDGGSKEVSSSASSSPRCRFMPVDYTKLILGDCPPTEKNAADRIRVLEWVTSVSSTKGDLLAPTGEIVREAARGGSTTVFRWLLGWHRERQRQGDAGTCSFPYVQMAVAAASHGHVGLLELLVLDTREYGAAEAAAAAAALRAPGVIGGAVRYGHLGVVRWLFEEIGAEKVAYTHVEQPAAWRMAGPPGIVYRNLPAVAFENGQVDILNYLYREACVPYGGRPTHVHACATKFFRDHAGDWAAGIFPGVNVKPAAATVTRMATGEGEEA